MNDERDKQSMDELVSATYREHSTERAPDELDRKILAMAAKDVSRSGGSTPWFGSWTRPLALAATVALSFAIVLEVTELPENVTAPIPSTAPPGTSGESLSSKSLSKEFTPRENGSVEEARNQARQRDGFNRDESLVAEPRALPELDVRQDAAIANTPTDVAEEGCDTEVRETPKDWLACIEELRRTGAVAAADREYEEYILQFPVE